MTIVYMISRIDQSGPNKVLLNMITGLEKKKVNIKILTFFESQNGSILKELKKRNIPIHCLNLKSKFSVLFSGRKRARTFLDKEEIDVIHSHGILPDYINSKLTKNSKKITTIHNCIKEDYRMSFGILKGWLFTRWHFHILKRMDDIICCSKTAYLHLKQYKKNCTYIQNGIRNNVDEKFNNKEQLRKQLKIKDQDLVYIYIGKLSVRKRILELLNLMEKELKSNEHFLVLGDGPLRSECLLYESSNIHILGFQKDINQYLNISDIYISNSCSEGFSISVLEALEKNLFLFLSDIPSHREIFDTIKNPYIGELFNEDNFRYKKKKLVDKMKNENPTEISKIKERYFSDEAMMEKYWEYYQ